MKQIWVSLSLILLFGTIAIGGQIYNPAPKNGNVPGYPLRAPDGSASAPSYSFVNSSTTGLRYIDETGPRIQFESGESLTIGEGTLSYLTVTANINTSSATTNISTNDGFYTSRTFVSQATAATLDDGVYIFTRQTASASAPGAGYLALRIEPANVGRGCNLVAYAGTSTLKYVIATGVGGGGC